MNRRFAASWTRDSLVHARGAVPARETQPRSIALDAELLHGAPPDLELEVDPVAVDWRGRVVGGHGLILQVEILDVNGKAVYRPRL